MIFFTLQKIIVIRKYYKNSKLEENLNLKIVKGSFAISSLAANSAPSELMTIKKKIQPYYFKILLNGKENIKFKIKYSLFLLSPKIFYKGKKLIKKRGDKNGIS